ncbi:MAG: glutamate--tRNA ligase [Dehalococcoidia bacterium]|nr:glutamate--tRNA ligase [Dehalococcoidia bacterium]
MTSQRPVRVRYAPSPTGDPHVGNIRTAIWAWLHARHTGGQFLIRIEDTDQSRKVEGSVERILASLEWLGLDWDEGPDIGGPYGPYVQSERLDLYRAAADRLLAGRQAYRCFCTPEELDAMRARQREQKRPPGYEGRCRNIPPEEAADRGAREPHVVRFAVPEGGVTVAEDLLRGPIEVANDTLDDFVILKSDGFPTYHLAHAVDDPAMQITHVTRGDEWLPSLPRHALLFDALGEPRPIYVHTPIILAPGGGKLSKRHGAKSVLEYAEDGFLPDAVLNFLCITGWGYGDETVFSRERLIEVFEIENLSLNPATFDMDKLTWLNGVYLREMPVETLAEMIAQRLERELPADVYRPLDRGLVEEATPLIQERIQTLADVTPLVDFFWQSEVPTPPADAFLQKKFRGQPVEAARLLTASARTVEATDPFEAAVLEERMRALAAELDVKVGDLFTLVRVAVTGRRVTPPLFESMEIVGQGVCVDRIDAAAAMLAEVPQPEPS